MEVDDVEVGEEDVGGGEVVGGVRDEAGNRLQLLLRLEHALRVLLAPPSPSPLPPLARSPQEETPHSRKESRATFPGMRAMKERPRLSARASIRDPHAPHAADSAPRPKYATGPEQAGQRSPSSSYSGQANGSEGVRLEMKL